MQTTDLPGKSDGRKLTQELAKLRKLHKRDSSRILELEQRFKTAEGELKQLKQELELKERDIQVKTTDIKRARLALTSRVKDGEDLLMNKLLKEVNFYRSRLEGKCLEVSALEGKLQLLTERLRSSSKQQLERKEIVNSASPVRVNKSLQRKRSEGGLNGTLTGPAKTARSIPMERSLSSEKLRRAYREVCRSRASVVVTTYKSNAK